MAKLYKFSGYYIDANDDWNAGDIAYQIANSLEMYSNKVNVEGAEIAEWHDGHILNKCNCPIEEYEKYFNDKNSDSESLKYKLFRFTSEAYNRYFLVKKKADVPQEEKDKRLLRHNTLLFFIENLGLVEEYKVWKREYASKFKNKKQRM